jgi:ABC transporter DrrB family efflux protein
VPGFITTGIIWQGMMSAAGIAEDLDLGFFDRLRSLPIPRSAVLAGRAVADTATQTWGLLIMTIIGFAIGFRLHANIARGILAFLLIIVFSFAFEWIFITLGMYAGNAQAAQGMSLILIPFTFISSAFVPVKSMPGVLRAIANHQPITFMVDAVRALTQGAPVEAQLGHSAIYFIIRALLWSAALVVVFAPIAIARYRRG